MKNENMRHPLSAAFPSMSEEEYKLLVDDIAAHGLFDPVVLLDDFILDGWHRHMACADAGVECVYVEFDSDSDPAEYVWSKNASRRSLTASQRAAAIIKINNWRERGRIEIKSAPGADLIVKIPPTAKSMAKQAGVSERTIEQAKTAERAGFGNAVRDGEISAKKAVEIITGKARQYTKPESVQIEPFTEDEAADSEIEQLRESLDILREDHDRMGERLAVAAMQATDEEKAAAAELIAGLREENRMLKINLDAVTASRDGLMRERNEMLKQIKAQRKEIDRLKK